VSQGVEASNDILFPNSALRVIVQNSYLEAWFCPVFFGGSGGSTPNTATLTNPVFDSISHTGSATFSSVSNLLAGDLVAMKTTNGRTPSTNYAHPSELVQFQVVEVTAINGNNVSFQSWGTYDGNLAGGNPLLQLPDSPGLAQWNGYLNQDITLSRNQFVENFVSTEKVWTSTGGSPTTLPRSTQVNTGNAPKGMIEIKMAKNVLINGNTFEGWELGFTVTSRNQGNTQTSGGFPWAGVFNVTISNNWWKKTQNWDRIYGYPIGGPQLEDNEYSNMRSGPFTFSNNLVESGVGPILAAMGAADNVTVTHNTYPGSDVPVGGSMVIGQGAASSNFVFVDNILPNNEYGRNCQSSQPCWPGLVQNHNVILDNRSLDGKRGDGPLNSRYPNDFIAANQSAVGWVDPLNVNYALASSSPYKGKASDGTDPGVDMDALLAALGGVATPPAVTITNQWDGSTEKSNGDTAAPSVDLTGVTTTNAESDTLLATNPEPALSSELMIDAGWSVVGTGDFNGDKNEDLLWNNPASGETSMWLMDGTGLVGVLSLLTDVKWKIIGTGDFDGDGKSDLIWYNAVEGAVSIWLMNGTTVSSFDYWIVDPNWKVVGTGDFDGDGRSDLLWYNAASCEVSFWYMNGISISNIASYSGLADWTVTEIADFDGDGKADLQWYSPTSGQTVIWWMN
jgi:hypothetical protein